MGESKGTATARWLPSATSLVYLIMLVSTVSAQSSGFSQALCSNLNTGSSNQQCTSPRLWICLTRTDCSQLRAITCPMANATTPVVDTPMPSFSTRAVGARMCIPEALALEAIVPSTAPAFPLKSVETRAKACMATLPSVHHRRARKAGHSLQPTKTTTIKRSVLRSFTFFVSQPRHLLIVSFSLPQCIRSPIFRLVDIHVDKRKYRVLFKAGSLCRPQSPRVLLYKL